MTTTAAYRRHDISDRAWETLEPLLPGGPGKVGRPAQNNRRFINGVFRVLSAGAPWRDLPPDYGHWASYNRFRNWQKDGTWERLLDTLANDPDLEWLMIDASYVKAHQHNTGAVRGNQAVGRAKEGLTTKLRLAVDAHGMPVRMLATAGTAADCTQAEALLDGTAAEYLLAAARDGAGATAAAQPEGGRGSMMWRCTGRAI